MIFNDCKRLTSGQSLSGNIASFAGGSGNYTAYKFTDGYRHLNIANGTWYIDPTNGTSISNGHSNLHEKCFTQTLSYPIQSGYNSYYISDGIYMSETSWERLITSRSNDYNNGGTRYYWVNWLYRINGNKLYGSGGPSGCVVIYSDLNHPPISNNYQGYDYLAHSESNPSPSPYIND